MYHVPFQQCILASWPCITTACGESCASSNVGVVSRVWYVSVRQSCWLCRRLLTSWCALHALHAHDDMGGHGFMQEWLSHAGTLWQRC